MPMKVKLIRAAVIAAFLPAFVAGCSPSTASPTAKAPADAVVAQASAGAGFRAPDFSQLAEQAGPAVVNISVTKPVSAAAAELLPFDENDPLFGFFRHFQLPVPKQAPMRGVGSGFIVSPDGYVLTNAHVVDGAKEVDVKLTDRREFTAKVVGTDRNSDIALLKIEAKDLPVVRIGHSQDIKVGQWVVAMGSPFGFQNSVTAGIVSAKSRSLPGEGYVPVIHTDVARNPRNPGGPLFDLNGNVIGINSQIYSQTGGYMGLSFAIPIDVAMHVKDQLQKYGKVTRGRIGVAIQPVNQSLAQSFGLAKPEGALVSSVDDEGPAARAGIQPGDVILALNNQPVRSVGQLRGLLHKAGKHVALLVQRDAARMYVPIDLG